MKCRNGLTRPTWSLQLLLHFQAILKATLAIENGKLFLLETYKGIELIDCELNQETQNGSNLSTLTTVILSSRLQKVDFFTV